MNTEAYVRLFTNIHRAEKRYANPGIFPFPCSRCTYPTTGRCQECNAPLCFLCQNGGKDGQMVCLECHVAYIREQAAQFAQEV